MRQKVFGFHIFMALVLSGCAAQASQQTAQAPASATSAAAKAAPPAATPTDVAAPATPTAGASACTDSAGFVADVTAPDYSHFDPRESFVKTWRVKNTGTCSWTADYRAVYSRGDALGGSASIPLSQTAPGATLDISVTMTAPATDGKYESFYQLNNQAGGAMPIDAGDTLWVLITVGKVVVLPPTSPTPGPTPSGTAGLGTASCIYSANQDFASQILAMINAARATDNLPALSANDQLNAAAQAHSADMACHNYLSHTGFDGSTPESRIAASGYVASLTRGNIYAQPPQYGGTPQSAMDWWIGDPVHQAAILNADVTEVGIGYAYYSRSTLGGYFTVDFAKP